MAPPDRSRRALFVLSLAVLIAWGATVALLGPAAGGADPGAAGGAPTHLTRVSRSPAAEAPRPDAAGPALRFLAAYLRYERGAPGRGDRRSLARLSTPAFARRLLQAPVRIPAGRAPPPEWVSRVVAVRVGIFEGRQALLVGVVVVGTGGSHVLTLTLVRRDGRWLVTGLGE
ncbi:MAG: hypothetical protein JSS68_09145 [Actinobacteria bacterium]|nr:hypothetical protein [Actinomycetota bacterium]